MMTSALRSNLDLQINGHFAMQTKRHVEIADALDWFAQ